MSEAKTKGVAGQTSWAVPKSSKALFCADCGSILDLPDGFNIVKCPDCTYTVQGTFPDLSAARPTRRRAALQSHT
jgi:ribosomal protein S27E